ncbi:lipoprotein signal peptidase [Phycisphaerae bacterium RAS1]|nr:lipoprotein signal peptidase [Phycisphaerae bacterium RAS1]
MASQPTPLTPTAAPVANGAHAPADAHSPGGVELSAMRDVLSHTRFWFLAVAGLALDLWSKEWAFGTLRLGGRREVLPHVLEFQTMLNPGALFGIGARYTSVFLVASVLALALVLWMFAQSSRRRWLLHIALGAILAGALGNMYDRIFVQLVRVKVNAAGAFRYCTESRSPDGLSVVLTEFPPHEKPWTRTLPPGEAFNDDEPVGYVRDFIKIPTKLFGKQDLWPWVFNVADMLLVGGVGILAVRLWFDRGEHLAPAAATGTPVGDGSGTPPAAPG